MKTLASVLRLMTAAMAGSACVLTIASPVWAQSITFPANAGVINVRDFGAVGDGVADDTASINAALNAPRPNGASSKTVYIPDGVYRVTGTVAFPTSRITLQGQSRAGAIIRLSDNAANFQNSAAPRHVLSTRLDTGFSANEFRVSIFDLTIDSGIGNPGAHGVKFHPNNQGSMRNITIRSSDPDRIGVIGLDFNGSDKGPGMVRNVSIEGFDAGVSFGGTEYGIVFENLTLTNQRVVGIRNIWNIASIRGLTTVGSVPVIQQDLNTQNNFAWAVLTILDANLTGIGAASAIPAMDLRGSGVYLRNIQTTGFAAALRDDGVPVPGASIPGEYVMPRPLSLWSEPGGGANGAQPFSLNLPVLDTPEVAWDAPATWASVTSFGAVANDNLDDSAGIQAAIDSGATTIYFPAGSYNLAQGVVLRGNVRRVMGMESTLAAIDPLRTSGTGVFIVGASPEPVVVVERFSDNTLGAITENFHWFEHSATNRTLVVRTAQFGRAYRGSGPGTVFAEDLTFNDWRVGPGQTAYFRQANPENEGVKITNTGGTCWILGIKTEKPGSAVETFAAGPGAANPGRTEVLGTLVYPVDTLPLQQPMFRAVDSELSVVIGESSFVFGTDHTGVIEHEIGGVKRRLHDTETNGRVGFFRGATLGMYSGRIPNPNPPAYSAASNRYLFEESGGLSAADALGAPPRPVTLVGTAAFVPGRFGNALALNSGSAGTITTSAGSPALTTEQGAVSLWINSSFNYTDLGMILYGTDTTDTNANGGGTQNEMHLNFVSGGNVNFFIEGGSNDLALSSNRALNDGQWHHIVVSWDRAAPAPDGSGEGYSEMFVDGRRVSWARTTFNSFPISAFLRLGRPNSAGRTYTGLLDDLRLFNRRVGHGEAMDLYFGGLGFTNYAPAVNAGPDNVVQTPSFAIAMRGEVADDGQPTPPGTVPLSVSWSVVSGPSNAVVFSPPGSPTANAAFPVNGTYVLRLSASDGVNTTTDDVSILVVTPLPPPWDNDDVGGANAIGYATTPDGGRSFTVFGSGGGPGGFFDGLHYVYQQLTAFSNVEVQARITDIPCGNTGNAGVMYRQQLIGQSAQVALLVTSDRQLVLINRSGSFGGSGFQQILPSVTLPIYLRMERVNANAARPWYSLDGFNWVPLSETFAATGFVGSYLGLYSANNAGSLCPTSFDRVRLGARCRPDVNSDAELSTQDIFDYLNLFFASSPAADFDGSGTIEIQDVFAFLNAWFTGCV
ncbi:MAG: hypothetical protein K2W85_15785 [Phycisphaerales bacterium]|nr:hypothetical protein [Phycisphaerales bacterium]